jgi:hypothetical protein
MRDGSLSLSPHLRVNEATGDAEVHGTHGWEGDVGQLFPEVRKTMADLCGRSRSLNPGRWSRALAASQPYLAAALGGKR